MMKRSNKISVYLLLAVYLPMLLLASFHTHHISSCCNPSAEQGIFSKIVLDDDCLLCQFLQTPYEQAFQIASLVILPKAVALVSEPVNNIEPAFILSSSSRAPPVL